MPETIDDQVIADAQSALDKSIRRRTKQGDTVSVARPLYHEGLTTPRCVLTINGQDVRFFYRKATKRWVRA